MRIHELLDTDLVTMAYRCIPSLMPDEAALVPEELKKRGLAYTKKKDSFNGITYTVSASVSTLRDVVRSVYEKSRKGEPWTNPAYLEKQANIWLGLCIDVGERARKKAERKKTKIKLPRGEVHDIIANQVRERVAELLNIPSADLSIFVDADESIEKAMRAGKQVHEFMVDYFDTETNDEESISVKIIDVDGEKIGDILINDNSMSQTPYYIIPGKSPLIRQFNMNFLKGLNDDND